MTARIFCTSDQLGAKYRKEWDEEQKKRDPAGILAAQKCEGEITFINASLKLAEVLKRLDEIKWQS